MSQLTRLNRRIQGLVTEGNRGGTAYVISVLARLLDRPLTTQGRV